MSLYGAGSEAVRVHGASMTIAPRSTRTLDLRSTWLVTDGFAGTGRAAGHHGPLASVVNEIVDGLDHLMTCDGRR